MTATDVKARMGEQVPLWTFLLVAGLVMSLVGVIWRQNDKQWDRAIAQLDSLRTDVVTLQVEVRGTKAAVDADKLVEAVKQGLALQKIQDEMDRKELKMAVR